MASKSEASSKHTDSFGLVLGGKLKLKGEKTKKRKKRSQEEEGEGEGEEEAIELPEYSTDPVVGSGRLTSSGVVVMGIETDFSKELEIGDSLLVTVNDRFRNTQTDESRVVNMVLGKTSLNVEAPFTCDLTSPTSFMFVKKAPDPEALRAARREQKKKLKQQQQESKTVTYKVVVPGSGTWKTWKTVTESSSGLSREEMLIKRAKMKSDRHC